MESEDKLNEWAARFIGEDDDLVADAVNAKWYTSSPGAAMAVLYKMASMGKKVELDVEDGKVEVECGGCTETGTFAELPTLIVRACKACHANG
jgi:hypothetical protein